MKRAMIIASVLLAGMLVPSPALSATQFQAKDVRMKRGAFTINFTVYTLNGKPKQVGNFSYTNADANCETGGPISVNGTNFGTTPQTRAKVKDHRFRKTYQGTSDGGGETKNKFTGKFTNNNETIKGTLKVTGDFPAASAENCNTGKINWIAN